MIEEYLKKLDYTNELVEYILRDESFEKFLKEKREKSKGIVFFNVDKDKTIPNIPSKIEEVIREHGYEPHVIARIYPSFKEAKEDIEVARKVCDYFYYLPILFVEGSLEKEINENISSFFFIDMAYFYKNSKTKRS